MSTATTEVKNDKALDKKNGNAPMMADSEDVGSEYVIDRPSFSPESLSERDPNKPKIELYKGPPVQGLWFAHRSLGIKEDDSGRSRNLFAYFVKLTMPCIVFDREGTKIDAKVDDEIMVWETAQIVQAIPPAVANHPTHVVHMRMVPQFRAPHPNDAQKKMWTFKFYPSKKNPIVSRKSIVGGASAIQQLLATLPAHMQQAARMPALGEGTGDDSGLPF